MQEVIIEPVLGEKLGKLAGQAILCDPQGRVLGFFSPTPDHPLRGELQLEPPWSIEETERLRKQKTGKPLAEILGRLGIE